MMSLDRAKPAAFEHQDAVGQDRRDAHAGHERDVQQERESDRAAEEFGEVGRHRRHFADDPERPDHRFGEMLAAQFGQVAPGDDAELGRQRLKQHRSRYWPAAPPTAAHSRISPRPGCWWRNCRGPYRRSRRSPPGRRTGAGCASASCRPEPRGCPRRSDPSSRVPTRATASLIASSPAFLASPA